MQRNNKTNERKTEEQQSLLSVLSNPAAESKRYGAMTEMKHPGREPESQSMDHPTVTLKRDFWWARVPEQENTGIGYVARPTNGLGADCCGIGTTTLYPIYDSVSEHSCHCITHYCCYPVDACHRFSYNQVVKGNTAKNFIRDYCCSGFDFMCDWGCTLGSIVFDGIYKITCCAPGASIFCCSLADCSPSFNSFDRNTLRAFLSADSFAEAISVMKNTSSRMRNELVYKHGATLLQSVFYAHNEISLADKKQIISYISERQPPFLYRRFFEQVNDHCTDDDMAVERNFLSIAVFNTKPDAMELLKFFLEENNFSRFANRYFMTTLASELTEAYQNNSLSRFAIEERIKLLKKYGLVLDCNLAKRCWNYEATLKFFESKSNWVKNLNDMVGEHYTEEAEPSSCRPTGS